MTMMRPDGRTASISVQSGNSGSEWTYVNTDMTGIYSLRGLPQGRELQFAVNVDAAESDLARIDRQELPPELVVRDALPALATGGSSNLPTDSAWNQRLLWAALALVFTESFLAWQFGRGVA